MAHAFRCAYSQAAYVDKISLYINDPSLIAKHAKINREIVKDYTVEATASKLSAICQERLLST